jgi:hypothetical protein
MKANYNCPSQYQQRESKGFGSGMSMKTKRSAKPARKRDMKESGYNEAVKERRGRAYTAKLKGEDQRKKYVPGGGKGG